MNIVFIGPSTEDKRFLILCLAKIISSFRRTIIHSNAPYGFEDDENAQYDYMGVEIHHLSGKTEISDSLDSEACNLFDLGEFLPFKPEYKAVLVCEPSRRILEESVVLASKYLWGKPALEMPIVYLNILEFCRVGQKYLDGYWERNSPSFTKNSETFTVYYEEKNRATMIESQFTGRLSLKALTPLYKAVLVKLIERLFSLSPREIRKMVRKAERLK